MPPPDTNYNDHERRLLAELRYFNAHRQEWVRDGHENEWAVVHCDRLIGFFETAADGVAAGREHFELLKFLVKQVTSDEGT